MRLFAPTQADPIAKKICMVSGQMYATPAYLKSIGNPSKPVEFGQASFIGFEDNNHQYLNFFKGCGFVDLTARNFPLTTDNRQPHRAVGAGQARARHRRHARERGRR